MENINRAIADGAHIVARVVEYQIRQAASSTVPTATSSPSLSATGMPSMSVPTVSAAISSSTDPAPSPSAGATGNGDGGGGGGGGGGSSSPLLFFVALGFGVVFTNLWIIVGVKYCFRYNARNRAMARLDENGEPIDLQNMPARPHRRRREKKLMTMDEVNEKFPMLKYKTWVLERKKEGLPTAGGISAPSSRPNSVRSVEGIIPEQPSDPRDSIDEPTTNAVNESDRNAQNQPKSKEEQKSGDEASTVKSTTDVDKDVTATNDKPEVPAAQVDNPPTKDSLHRTSEDDEEEEEDDHINPVLDPDMMGSSGDTCAICIDTLEDDDDVRGLTCGHAFHAVCLDPWLTNRRACCPLCKADYYTPKARPQPAEGETRDPNAPTTAPDPSRNNGRLNYPRAPVRSFAWSHFRDAPRQMWSSRFDDTPRDPAQMDRRYRSRQQPTQASRTNTINQAQPTAPQEEREGNAVTRFRNRFPPFRLNQVMRRNREVQGTDAQPNTNTAHPSTTPSQLEAGIQPSTTQSN